MEENEPALPVYQRLIGKGALDGFVLVAPLDDDPRIAFLRRAGVPFVLHGRSGPAPDYPYFDIDNEGLARHLTTLLVTRGHRRIALLNGVAGRSYVTARSRGWRAALAAAGLPAPAGFDLTAEMDEAHGLLSTVRLFSGDGPRPTALICGNLRIARGAFQALEALNLSVPADVSVVAHDDHLPHLRASAFFPALTVTLAPLRDSWQPLADCLAGAIGGKPLETLQVVGEYRLVERASVAPPRG
jgi:LacI family transcriptional regulator